MSGVYVPGAFNKKKEVVSVHVDVPENVPENVPIEKVKKEEINIQLPSQLLRAPRAPRAPKPTIVEIKPVEVKQAVWGGKTNFVDCLKTIGDEPNEVGKETGTGTGTRIGMKSLWGNPIMQKEVKKEELDFFMNKYDAKLRKLYENTIYYDKEFFDKLRINGEQGYILFCKFMFHVI